MMNNVSNPSSEIEDQIKEKYKLFEELNGEDEIQPQDRIDIEIESNLGDSILFSRAMSMSMKAKEMEDGR